MTQFMVLDLLQKATPTDINFTKIKISPTFPYPVYGYVMVRLLTLQNDMFTQFTTASHNILLVIFSYLVLVNPPRPPPLYSPPNHIYLSYVP